MSRESLEELRERLLRDEQVQEMIRVRAFEIYRLRGGQPRGEAHDWFQAESEVLAFLIEEESRQASGSQATGVAAASARPSPSKPADAMPKEAGKRAAAKATTQRKSKEESSEKKTAAKRASKKPANPSSRPRGNRKKE